MNRYVVMECVCRTSHEVRGLKYTLNEIRDMEEMSHLTRGAWIEIFLLYS